MVVKIKEKKEIDWGGVVCWTLFVLLIALVVWFVAFIATETIEYNKWYNSLSEEEKLEVQKEKEAAYQANISTYEVVGVSKYVRYETNTMDGILDTDICYAFEYIDGDGNLKSVDNFEHHDSGLTKVAVGDADAYIINKNGETTRTLQLTKETLKNIQTLSTG